MERATAFDASLSGREREVALLLREHDEARERSSARFAFVTGPRGIGKTHLFAVTRRGLAEKAVKAFESRASRAGSTAYALFADIVPELITLVGELGVPARTVADLARRVGPINGRTSGLNASDDRRLDLFDAVAELFALAGRATPAYLFADVDAADRASLELLRYVAAASTAPSSRAAGLFVVSFRDDAALPPLLAELVARTPATTVPLRGLDLEGIRGFLSRKDIAERLLEATGGVPSALEDAVTAQVVRPFDLVQRRMAALPEGHREALLALAVLGRPASAEAVGKLLGTDEPLAVLDALVKDRFLEVRIAGGEPRYALAREGDREALLATAARARVTSLHALAGELYADADLEAAARHFLTAEPSGRGAAYALKAGELLLSRSAYAEAAEMFRRALEGSAAEGRGAVHAKVAEALRASSDYLGAMRHIGLARKGQAEHARRALRAEAARLAVSMGKLAVAERLSRRVLGEQAVAVGNDPAGAQALTALADAVFLRGKYDEARTICEVGLADASVEPVVALALRNTLGKVFLTQAAYDDALAAFAKNVEQASASGNAREEARGLINQGVVLHRKGERRGAIALYRAGLELCGPDRALAAFALSNLGSLYAESAEFEPAVEHLGRALSAFTRARRQKEVAHAALNLGRLHLFLGESDRAAELCEHARSVAEEVGDPYLVAQSRLLSGEILEARGQTSDAVVELSEAREAFAGLKSPRYGAESALALARVHLARGERKQAQAELSRDVVDELARTQVSIAVERDLVGGELALLAGDLPDATRRLSNAKERLLETPDLEGPYRVYHLLAKLRAAAGDASGAAADSTRSARLLDELAGRVPLALRTGFLRVPRRAVVLASAERELTPSAVARALSLEPAAPVREHNLVGEAPGLKKIFKVLDAVAKSPATVLIRGESGTGKELLADAIHKKSTRRDMPFVKVNCAAMVEDLLLSELFGHEKGAFTGAVRERKGRFELADGGTIFLDEIGDISPKAQVALLRVLQEREFERVGGQKTVRIDVRVICATNRPLEQMIAAGQFREDLYYRLKGVMLELPSLRERVVDLPVLTDHFLAKFARERGEPKKVLSPEALRVLEQHKWPGNIRELENVISSASIFAAGKVITPEAFEHVHELAELARAASAEAAHESAEVEGDADGGDDDDEDGPSRPVSLDGAVDYFSLAKDRGLSLKDLRHEVEVQCIRAALTQAKGNISEAARLLKMKRSRLSQIVNGDPLLRAAAKGE